MGRGAVIYILYILCVYGYVWISDRLKLLNSFADKNDFFFCMYSVSISLSMCMYFVRVFRIH